jgi:hypothetical protein
LDGEWTAYHSLNLSEHEYKRWAEIDFLVVGPKGILVLEVKGGPLWQEDGVWYGRNRKTGQEHMMKESPYNQAGSAMYALQKLLKVDIPHLSKNIFGWGVVFPDLDWNHTSPEHPEEVVADRSDMLNAQSFKTYLTDLVDYWNSKSRSTISLSRSELTALRQAIRPDVDRYPPLTLQISKAVERLQALTEEQYDKLDIIEANRRTIVSGGAGTGKTFLIMQLARRELATGRSPLVVVSSPILAAWLRKMEPDRGITIEPFRSEYDVDDRFDVLLVDEGQDLMNLDTITVLSDRLQDGMEGGRWHWFMDENNQAGITGTFDPEALEYLAAGLGSGMVTRVPLSQNVRNTKEIAEAVKAWTLAEIGTPKMAGHGEKPTVKVVQNELEMATEVEKVLSDLLSKEVEPRDIGIVFPGSAPPTLFDSLSRKIRKRLSPLTIATIRSDLGHKIVYGSAEDFKGLERPIMLAIGFDRPGFANEKIAELYIATTRANYRLHLLVGPQLLDALLSRGNTHLVEKQQ